MRADLARALAGGFLAAEWTRPGLVDGGAVVLGRRVRWMPALTRQVLALYPRPPLDRPRELAAIISTRPAAAQAGRARPMAHPLAPVRMVSNPWRLVVLHDLAEVGSLLGLSQPELAWFSDPRHWSRTAQQVPLQHYRISSRTAPSGAIRVLEAPKRHLKAIQRQLLQEIVGRIPPHEATHGFRVGRSVGSYAAPHAGRAVVIRSDLEGFFASVTVGRVYGVLRTAGYPEPVAHCLAGLMTTVLPLSAWRKIPRPTDPVLLDAHWRLGRRLAAPHLPQGAPTSPALANLAAYRMDIRLDALALSWGGQYTRYADDIAMSGDRGWGPAADRILGIVAEIARTEGFRLNARKTGVLPQAGRQVLGGLVVNDRPHVSRAEVDVLRATLHNCIRHGPSTQNRQNRTAFEQYLQGRIAWVAQHDRDRGARLRTQFDAIDWTR
ncbi:reverse transcriptase family protein [Leekyejoonella antrihumi]|uniref:RNA-directed DNA polymerase n=1 Tax=Leekyejoonella antrihumi TaxID=1660198 RepID=A0A563E723_9MICO|nr:reverse transcriptase family protein [Leekyejoonella antrihumi]TWP38316.1 RNA-directed DNA polymerase [Leekyejoonella antrihumi]